MIIEKPSVFVELVACIVWDLEGLWLDGSGQIILSEYEGNQLYMFWSITAQVDLFLSSC